jgi:predicted PurR-regulated permease PerM
MTIRQQARRNRLALVVAATVLVVAFIFLARGALFPFIISGALTYLLYPVVRGLEGLMPWRERWPGPSRVAAIAVIYVAAIAVAAGAIALIVPPTFREATEFVDSVPDLFAGARETIEGWNETYTDRVPEDLREQIESSLAGSGDILVGAARAVLSRTVGAVSGTMTAVIGLAIVPFLVFYLLKDREAAAGGFYSLMPPNARRHARNVVTIANDVLGAYVRAQLTLGVIVGAVVFLGLFALGIRFAALLGVIAGVFELIPIIGPLLGAIPGVLVALATSPADLPWVILLYAGVQLVENWVLVPRIQGRAVDIHPAIIMLLLVISSEVAGLWGVIVAVPLAAVARDVFLYFLHEWSEEPAEPTEPPEESPAGEAPPAEGA